MDDKYAQAELDSPVYSMRSVPVMREPRAVLITFSRSENLCQSLRAHFIQPENSTKSLLIYHFTSFSLTRRQHHNLSSWSIEGAPLSLCSQSLPVLCYLICLTLFSRFASMYQPLYLCKSICSENEACLMSWTLLDFMLFLPGNGGIMKM